MILCRPTGEYYIGGTKGPFRARFLEHRNLLRQGKSRVHALQRLHDQHGMDALEFTPLMCFWPDEVRAKEMEAIAKLRPALNTLIPKAALPAPSYAKLTIEDVPLKYLAEKTGIGYGTLRARYLKGLRGPELVAPKHAAPRKAYTRQL